MIAISSLQWTKGCACIALLGVAGIAMAQPKPNEPAHGWIPTPAFTSPTKYQKFAPSPTLKVSLSASIPALNPGGYTVPSPFDFVAYAKASPYTEKWHVHLLKLGPDGKEVLVEKFEGLITGSTFSVVLDGNWFGKHGAGKYGARAYLSQIMPKGSDNGMATGVGFEILVPVVRWQDQKHAPQVVRPFGGAVSSPPASRNAQGSAATSGRLVAPSSQLAPVKRPAEQ